MFVHQRYKFYFSNDRNLIFVTTLSFWVIPKNRIQEKNYKNENVIFIYFLRYSEISIYDVIPRNYFYLCIDRFLFFQE